MASWARLGGRNRIPSRPNIDPKNDQNFDAFGDRLFARFGGFYVPKWTQLASQNLLEIDVYLERLFFKKKIIVFPKGKTMILLVPEP